MNLEGELPTNYPSIDISCQTSDYNDQNIENNSTTIGETKTGEINRNFIFPFNKKISCATVFNNNKISPYSINNPNGGNFVIKYNNKLPDNKIITNQLSDTRKPTNSHNNDICIDFTRYEPGKIITKISKCNRHIKTGIF